MTTFNTGNPLGSTDVYDRYDNSENLDYFSNGPLDAYPDRFGVSRQSLQGIRNASQYVNLGPYAAGLVFTSLNQVFSYDAGSGAEFYAPGPAITLPYTTTGVGAAEIANFRSVGDAVLRSDLNDQVDPAKGSGLLGFIAATGAASRRLLSKLGDFVTRADYLSDAAFNAAKTGKVSHDGSERLRSKLFIAGTEELTGATVRDAYVVGRDVVGATDCHGFADRTVMSGVTDAGTYGSFDCTVKLNGSNAQNHLYSFQHRSEYAGSGSITSLYGLFTAPKHSGTGVVGNCEHVVINDVNITAGGTVDSQIGVRINNLAGGANNVALNIAQTSGYAIFAGGGAPSYVKGFAGFGRTPTNSVAIEYQGAAVGAIVGFSTTTTTTVQNGVIGNFDYQFVTNGAIRAEIKNSAGQYAFRPGADNAQPLGDVTRRWSQLFAGTATISTSDAREKTEVRNLTAAELSAAKALAKEIGAFRFLVAVAEKGDKAREHIGMTVQRAIEVMESHGLDPFAYSFICYDKWEDGDLYSFRFDGLLAFIAAGFEARLAALEDRI